MTDHTGTDTRSSPGRGKVTGQLNRNQLEQALGKALAGGAELLTHQIRYILAISQTVGIRSTPAPILESPLTLSDSRLSVLVDLAPALDERHRRILLNDLQKIGDSGVRLRLITRLLTALDEATYQQFAMSIWEQTTSLENALTRSEVLLDFAGLTKQFPPTTTAPVSSPLADAIEIAQSMSDAEGRIRSLVSLAYQLPPQDKIVLLNRVLVGVNSSSSNSLRANLVNSIADRLPAEIEDSILGVAISISSPAERARALTALCRTVSDKLQTRVREEVLTTIEDIPNEDERLAALAALAPYLEPANEISDFPALLEHALAIAVSLTRRNLRARALVALAPHLTLDLQGEALAAVHSLPSERERAMMLAELAPTLPPNMLVASLAVAHTMREQDARVHALTVLAHYAPKQAREQTLLDALAAASNLPHHYERVTALLALVDILPKHLSDQAFTNALETTRHITNENARARAISLLGQHLPPRLMSRALETALQISDQQQQFSALIGIIPHMETRQRTHALRQMLESIRQVPIDYKRARLLVALAPNLPPELIQDALETAHSLSEPFDRVSAYIALAQNLPPTDRPRIIAQTWKLISEIDDGYDRSSALASIAPFLPPAAKDDLARHADHVIRSIEDEYDRASAISILAPLLAHNHGALLEHTPSFDYTDIVSQGILAAFEIPQASSRARQVAAGCALWITLDAKARYNLWCEVAQQLTTLPLPDVLVCLGTLVPVFVTFEEDKKQMQDIARILGIN